ncbi:MAG: carbamoyltransferase [Pyrinomonadaceae bacterium]
MVNILGISGFYHDSAVCLVVDGDIVAAAQEERFTRTKHDSSFPLNAVRYCLSERNLNPGELDYVAFYDKPLLKFDRLLETYLDYAPSGFLSFRKSMPLWIKEKLWMPDLIRSEVAKAGEEDDPRAVKKKAKEFRWKLLFGDHHESHAASAFYPSPFQQAAILTVDGVGEWATSSLGIGKDNDIVLLKELRFPDSLGLLYSAFTYYTGFKVNSGEYKVMGLAPYGEPKYVGVIKDKLLEICDDGSIRLNHDYFGYSHRLRMTNDAFSKLFAGPPRRPESPITQTHMDLARSIQAVTEEVLLKMTQHAYTVTRMKRLCLAGGVALNCVANGRVLREGPFEDIWIQPAAGDAGGALGIALAIWYRYLGNPRVSAESETIQNPSVDSIDHTKSNKQARRTSETDRMKGSFLGPRHSDEEIENFLRSRQLPYTRHERDKLPDIVAELLAAGKIVALHQGRMEFGPRALGGRSILADPRRPQMQSVMNLKIKFRESFRPFAPSVLREYVNEWFELDTKSPYMMLVADVKKSRRKELTPEETQMWGIEKLNVQRSEIPAVTHVDYSARIQTVDRDSNPLYWHIIEAFYRKTGCPVVINTSFNVRGEPIVCTLQDSYRCFMRTEIDFLVLETFVLDKLLQPASETDSDWKSEFRLD